MSISRENTFDPSKGYKQIRFHEDRDLLDSELNELQEMAIYERKQLLDVFFVPGMMISGGDVASIVGNRVSLNVGRVYFEGFILDYPATVLVFDPSKTTGTDYVWFEVLRHAVGKEQDAMLINPRTEERAAERESWAISLQIRDTSGDALPAGAIGRYTVKTHSFDRATGVVTLLHLFDLTQESLNALRAHIGTGGNAHAAATTIAAGFMTASDKTKLEAVDAAISGHVGAGGNVHSVATGTAAGFMSAGDKTKLDSVDTALSGHVGAGGNTHAVATTSVAGFMSASDKTALDGHLGAGGAAHAKASAGADGFMAKEDKAKLDTLESNLTSHVGSGGATHAAATTSAAGFLSVADKQKLDQLSTTTPPAHTHEGVYAPLSHVGAAGSAHGNASPSQAGFLSVADYTRLDTFAKMTPITVLSGFEITLGSSALTVDIAGGTLFVNGAISTGEGLDEYSLSINSDHYFYAVANSGIIDDTALRAPSATETLIGIVMTDGTSVKTILDCRHFSPFSRSATIVVAASDASEVVKRSSDMVALGAAGGNMDEKTLNAAIARVPQGGRVILSAGNFIVSGSVVIRSGITLEGQGEATVIKLNTGTTGSFGVLMNKSFTTGKDYGIAVRNLKIDGNRANQSGGGWRHGISMKNLSRSIIENVFVTGAYGDGIAVGVGAFNTIRGCFAEKSLMTGINIAGSSFIRVEGCLAYRNGEYGIGSPSSVANGCTIIGNVVCGSTFDGINFSGTGFRVCVNRVFLNGQTTGADNFNLRVYGSGHVEGNFVRDDYTLTGGIGQGWSALVDLYESVNAGTMYVTSKGLYATGDIFVVGNDCFMGGVNADIEWVSDAWNRVVVTANRTTSTATTASGTLD